MAKPGEMSQGFGRKSKSSSARKQMWLAEQLNLEHPLVKLSQAIISGEVLDLKLEAASVFNPQPSTLNPQSLKK